VSPGTVQEDDVFSALGRIFKTPDLRRKVLFTLAIIGIFRLGSFIPAPFVDYRNVQQCLAGTNDTAGLYELINLFSGGALLQLSIFALGIMPYITASIITQLLRVVIPHFEALHKEGQAGQAKLTQYTRYLTIGLALFQSTTLITVAEAARCLDPRELLRVTSLLSNDAWYAIMLMVITMTAGTGLIMWLGEMITERGVGNGMSLLIFVSIAAVFPSSLWAIAQSNGSTIFVIVVAVGIVIMGLVVFVEQSQRRVPVQYAKRMVGRRTYGGTTPTSRSRSIWPVLFP